MVWGFAEVSINDDECTMKMRKLKVFISYSRQDMEFVDRLQAALGDRGIDAFFDRDAIEKGEEWWARIEQLITEADTVIFVLSPDSATSPICGEEVDFAKELNKRVIPIVARDLAGQAPPAALASLNYIFFIDNPSVGASGEFNSAVDDLARALETDISWLREHTRLGTLAERWRARDRRGDPLLRGTELSAAEAWLINRPKNGPRPTDTQIAFITESRKGATRRQRWAVAAALTVAVGAFSLAWVAKLQRDEALATESQFLATASKNLLDTGRPAKAIAATIEGLPQKFLGINDRPLVDGALIALKNARYARLRIDRVAPEQTGMSDTGTSGRGEQVDVSADGNRLLIRGYGAALWDLAASKILKKSNHSPARVIFNAVGDSLVTQASLRKSTVAIWSAKTGEERHRLPGPYESIDVSADGKRLLAVSSKGHATVLELSTGKEIQRINANGNAIRFAVTGKVSNLVALIEAGEARLYDAEEKRDIVRFQASKKFSRKRFFASGFPISRPPVIRSVSFARDDQLLIIEQDDGLLLGWEWSKGKLRFEIEADAFALNPAGLTLAVAKSDSIEVWDLERSEIAKDFRAHDAAIKKLKFGKNADLLLTISEDRSARLWSNIQYEPRLVGDFKHDHDIADGVLANVDTAATLDTKGTLYLWSASGAVERVDLKGELFLAAQQFGRVDELRNAAGAPLATISYSALNNQTGIFHVKQQSSETELFRLQHRSDQSVIAQYSGDPPLLLIKREKSVAVLENNSNRTLSNLPLSPDALLQAAFSPDGEILTTWSKDGAARLWHAKTGKDLGEIRCPERMALHVAVSSDQSRAAISSEASNICIWNIAEQRVERILDGHDGIPVLNFSPNDSRLVSGSIDLTARLWDLSSGKELQQMKTGSPVHSVVFSPDGDVIAVVDDDFVRLWDPETYRLVAKFEHGVDEVRHADISFDGTYLLILGDRDATMYPIWRSSTGFIEASRQLAARISPLTDDFRCELNLIDCGSELTR